MPVGLVNKCLFPKSNGDGLCVTCGEIEFVMDGPRGVTVPFRDVLNRPFPVCVKGQFPVVRSPFRSGMVGVGCEIGARWAIYRRRYRLVCR